MKKKIILGLAMTLAINSAAVPAITANAVDNKSQIFYGGPSYKIGFENVDYDNAPQSLKNIIESQKSNKGFIYQVNDKTGYTYIAVMAGEKPATGYSINVTDLEYNKGIINVYVDEKKPESDMMQGQIITYPSTITRVKGIIQNISVIDGSGDSYKDLASVQPVKGITVNKLKFDILNQDDIKNLPEQVRTTAEMYKERSGYFVFDNEKFGIKDNEGMYVMISLGMRNTTGYGIDVLSVEDNEGKTNIIVKEVVPGSDTYVGKAITFPYVIVRYTQGTPNVRVQTEDGTDLKSLAPIPVDTPVISPIEDKNWKDLKSYLDVPEDREWTVRFNRAVPIASMKDEAIFVLDSTGMLVPVKLSNGDDKKTVIVKPIENYGAGKTYYLFISQNLNLNSKSPTENKGYRMQFTIKEDVVVE